MSDVEKDQLSLKERIYIIIFEADTKKGKAFDVFLLWAILLSIVIVLLESVQSLRELFGFHFRVLEWVLTVLFLIEYVFRIYCARDRLKYLFSFFGLVDILSILPTFLSVFVVGSHSLLVIRGLRLLRIFRVFKLGRHTKAAGILLTALQASRAKITVFLGAVLALVLVMGSLMYLIEGAESGFSSIPRAMYWAVVTMTTVGYGDIVPQTPLGQGLAALIMICGYGIIAVPTGIVSAELANVESQNENLRHCKSCSSPIANNNAQYCHQCGHKL